jgi:hypothetical protein
MVSVRQADARRSTHLISLKGTEPQEGVSGLLVRASSSVSAFAQRW